MRKLVNSEMTKNLITVRWNDSLEKSYQKMRKENIRHLPVVDSNGKLIGITSDRDFQRAMRPIESNFEIPPNQESKIDSKLNVCDYMSWPVRTVPSDTELRVVTRRMIEEKISAFVVTFAD